MDPHSSLYIIPNDSPHNPFPHSLLRTRQKINRFLAAARLEERVAGLIRELGALATGHRVQACGFVV